MNSMLDRQFKLRLSDQTDTEIILAIADHAMDLGVVIPLTSENFSILSGYVGEIDIREDIFATVETRIIRLQKAAPVLLRFRDNPLAFLAGPIFSADFSEEDLEIFHELGNPDALDRLFLGALISKSSQVVGAYKAALDGSLDELEEMLRDDAVYVEIFGPDARELKWIDAVAQAVDYINTTPLAGLLEPNVDPVLAKYYVSYPGTDERHVIDALISAIFKREPEALKELLKRSGYTIRRLPQSN